MRALVGAAMGALIVSTLNVASAVNAQRVELHCQPVIRPAVDCTLNGYFQRTMTTECQRS